MVKDRLGRADIRGMWGQHRRAVVAQAAALLSRPAVLSVVVLAATAIAVTFGVAMHDTCLGYSGGPPIGSKLCVSDVHALYGLRGLAGHAFPYGSAGALGLPEGTVEYPVLTGLVAWLVAWPAAVVPSAGGYYLATSVVLLVVALAVSSLLLRMAGARALLFAASPLLVVYATQNWDLFPVATVVGGVLAWHRGRPGVAGVMFALGACFKVFPLLFLIPLYADVHARHGRRAAIRAMVPGVAVGVLVNLPFMLRDLDGWWQPFAFQQDRPVDNSALSVWSLFLQTSSIPLVNALATFSLLIGIALVCFFGSRRLERDGAYPFVQVCAALTVVWLLTAKASSPQFALWLLPFFVLLRVPFWSWLATTAAVLWCHIAFYAWIDLARAAAATGLAVPEAHLAAPVLARTAVFVALVVLFLRAESAIRPAPVTYRRGHAEPEPDVAAPGAHLDRADVERGAGGDDARGRGALDRDDDHAAVGVVGD